MESSKYNHENTSDIIAKLRAKPPDYLIYTYLQLHGMLDSNKTYLRRFSNIIFNRHNEIAKKLIMSVFSLKSEEILRKDLEEAKFLSCIYPRNMKLDPCPVFIQYFKPDEGIQYRILGFIPSPVLSLNSLVSQHGIIDKLVGFCGDFSYTDPGIPNNKSDHYASLCVLKRKSVHYLPYCDGILEEFINVLVSYFPENVTLSLTTLGETLIRTTTKSQIIQNLTDKYKNYKLSKNNSHILLSEYTEYVISNFSTISSYLEPFKCLPKPIGSLLCSVLQRFLLFFIRNIYLDLEKFKICENLAILYYSSLTKIVNMFQLYEDSHYIPPQALSFFNQQIEEFLKYNQTDALKNQQQINNLLEEITCIIDATYSRAIKFIRPLISVFNNFESFTWILLTEPTIDLNNIHETYHIIYNSTCQQCPKLFSELKELNSLLSDRFVEIKEQKIETKWMQILKSIDIPMILQVIECLLSLPASFEMIKPPINELKSNCDYSRTRTKLQFNFKIKPEKEIENTEDIFGHYSTQIKSIINSTIVDNFVD